MANVIGAINLIAYHMGGVKKWYKFKEEKNNFTKRNTDYKQYLRS